MVRRCQHGSRVPMSLRFRQNMFSIVWSAIGAVPPLAWRNFSIFESRFSSRNLARFKMSMPAQKYVTGLSWNPRVSAHSVSLRGSDGFFAFVGVYCRRSRLSTFCQSKDMSLSQRKSTSVYITCCTSLSNDGKSSLAKVMLLVPCQAPSPFNCDAGSRRMMSRRQWNLDSAVFKNWMLSSEIPPSRMWNTSRAGDEQLAAMLHAVTSRPSK